MLVSADGGDHIRTGEPSPTIALIGEDRTEETTDAVEEGGGCGSSGRLLLLPLAVVVVVAAAGMQSGVSLGWSAGCLLAEYATACTSFWIAISSKISSLQISIGRPKV